MNRAPSTRAVPAIVAGTVAAATLLLAACEESIVAPGACPEYCPTGQIEVLDSVYVTAVGRDSTFRGYLKAYQAPDLEVVSEGDPAESRGLIRFLPLNDTVFDETGSHPVASIDSFSVSLRLRERPATVEGLRLVLHRLPETVDSLTTWDDVAPYFDDSTIVATYAIPDTVESGDLAIVFPADSLPGFLGGSMVAAFGLVLRADSGAFVRLGTREVSQSARITVYVQAESGDSLVERTDARLAGLDTYVMAPRPDAGPDVLTVGGLPSARSLLRIALPPRVADSSQVVRATLLLVPTAPAVAAPRDTIRLRADPLTADVGAKSPIFLSADTVTQGSVLIPPAWTDTVRLDITQLVRGWQNDSTFPRSLMLRVVPEAGTVAELRFGSSRSAAGMPSLQLTYVPIAMGGSQ